MMVRVAGKAVTLGKSSFVGQGGEGSVYAKEGLAYKVYSDPSKAISPHKIQELSVLSLDNIIKPLDVVFSNKKPVGYTMKFIQGVHPLCQLFTKAFRARYGLSMDDVISLFWSLQEIVRHVHQKRILVVDLNEMNFLVSNDFSTPYAIDVDSYQTPSFPATAIMDSIRDRHSNGKFTEGSDWFSFAVVTFQLLAGIHPYKGRHPSIKSLDERMRLNVSVLNPEVRVPGACQDFSSIPKPLLKWFRLVLDKGERVPPPSTKYASVAPSVVRIVGSDNFVINLIREYPGHILDYQYVSGTEVVLGKGGPYAKWVNDGRITEPTEISHLHLAVVPSTKEIVMGHSRQGNLCLRNLTRGIEIPCDIAAEEVMGHDGTLYVKQGESVFEIEFRNLGSHSVPVAKTVASVMEKASSMFPGVIIQNMLGSIYALLLPSPGLCYPTRIKELDGYRIIDARLKNNVLLSIGFNKGKYDRFIFRFGSDFNEYDMLRTDNVDYRDINFVGLPTGICVMINEQDEVCMFSSSKGSKSLKAVNDPAIDGSMRLHNKGSKVVFSKKNKTYSMTVK